jgi:hypothetical protein
MEKFNLRSVNEQGIDKNKTHIPIDCPHWNKPAEISITSLENLLKKEIPTINLSEQLDNTILILDPSTLKITIEKSYIPSVSAKPFNEDIITFNKSPENYQVISGAHLMVDTNFLYVWIEKLNKWKRVLLSDFEKEMQE